jgi:hypothetical protein
VSAAIAQVAGLQPPQVSLIPHLQSSTLRKLKFSIAGELQKHAEVRIGVNGSAHLVVQILQPGGGLPFVAMFHALDTEADDLQRHAATLHSGLTAIVVGVGLRVSSFEGHQVLTADHVVSVNQLIANDFHNDLDRFEVRS